MTYVALRPVIISEGHGDVQSTPSLVRRTCEFKEEYRLFPLSPSIRSGRLSRLKRDNELERFIQLAALRRECDSIIIAADCDDGCAKDEVYTLAERAQPLATRLGKKIAIGFFVREFECLFLQCLPEISARYPELGIVIPREFDPAAIEKYRDAKGALSRMMTTGSYKETRDQANFVHALDLQGLHNRSRSFRHFCNCIDFLVNPNSGLVYPAPPTPVP